MRRLYSVLCFLACIALAAPQLNAQGARKKVGEGNELYKQEKYVEALTKYRDAELDDPQSPVIQYNIGSALYKQRKYEESLQAYEKALTSREAELHSRSYYNMGNTLYRMGKLPESIMAYKKALEANPDDFDAKHNLEFVRNKLKQQQQQQNQQDQQDQQQKQQGEGESGEEQQGEQQEQGQEGEEQEQQPQSQSRDEEMTKEEAERILNALKNDEKDLQEKRQVKAKGKVRVKKDW